MGAYKVRWQVQLEALERWQSVKTKLETEGSVWYVWWMDGVRQHIVNYQGAA